jgi:glycosyltransferase involved in cell wall biosynthesis
MNPIPCISVVLCTYNRCDILGDALQSLVTQDTEADKYEVIVVDNNSTDRTRTVVESLIERGHSNVRYLFEGKQGLSHARNTGVREARALIVTFTDDDIRAAPDWISSILRAFDEHPEVDLVGGKVLPRWNAPPPSWLTFENWAPLALIDYGNQSFYTSKERQQCLVGANLSVRKAVFDEVGYFRAEFQRVKDEIGSNEDHEFQLRFWQAGKTGLYASDVSVTADVQNERLTKAYHRRWYSGHGMFSARMSFRTEAPNEVTLFGLPAYRYSSLLGLSGLFLAATLTGQTSKAFAHETELRHAGAYIKATYVLHMEQRGNSIPMELVEFARKLLRKKYQAFLTRALKRSG